MSLKNSNDSDSKFVQNKWSLLRSLLIEKLKAFEEEVWSLSNCISKNSNFFSVDNDGGDENEKDDDDEKD